CLLHRRITLLGLVLGRRCRGNDGGMDNGPFAQEKTTFCQYVVVLSEYPCRHRMPFQKVAVAQHSWGIRYAFDGKFNTGEITHRLTVVNRILKGLISQAVPLLQEVDSQYACQWSRWAATPAGSAWVIRGRQGIQQALPGHQYIHLSQEAFPAGNLFLVLMLGLGEGNLFHPIAWLR